MRLAPNRSLQTALLAASLATGIAAAHAEEPAAPSRAPVSRLAAKALTTKGTIPLRVAPPPDARNAARPPGARKLAKVGPRTPPATTETTWIAWAVDQMLGPQESLRRKVLARRTVARPRPAGSPPAAGVPTVAATPAAVNAGPQQPTSVSAIETGAIAGRLLGAFWRIGNAPALARPVYRKLERDRVAADLPLLALASRSYDEVRGPAMQALDTDPGWRVLENARVAMPAELRRTAEESGFEAVAYFHPASRRIVVAIAGSRARISLRHDSEAAATRKDAYRDWWTNDIRTALLKGSPPPQFDVATRYIADIGRRYGGSGYTIECTGHSLGGGACVHAAVELGLRATTLNPISAGERAVADPGRIVNYVMRGELARVVYGLRGLAPTGTIYMIDDGREDLAASMQLLRFGPTAGAVLYAAREVIEAFRDHGADIAIDRLAAAMSLPRPR